MTPKEKETLENLLYKLQDELTDEDDKESISSTIELIGNI